MSQHFQGDNRLQFKIDCRQQPIDVSLHIKNRNHNVGFEPDTIRRRVVLANVVQAIPRGTRHLLGPDFEPLPDWRIPL